MTSAVESVEVSSIPHAHRHVVQFYEDERFLAGQVVDFIGSGLSSGHAAVVIATRANRERFVTQLRAGGCAVDAHSHSQLLIMLDAEETLARFMNDGAPDWDRFRAAMAPVLERAAAVGAGRVRAYGEMVDVLWRAGNQHAAVRLEELWNDLANVYEFELLCAYRMGNFYKESDAKGFEAICRVHTRAVPTEAWRTRAEDDVDRLREISMLQQRAFALASEVAERKVLEEALRETVHDLHVSEQKLRRSEAHLREYLENAAEGLHWVAADGTILWANRAELDLLGYRADEYIGHHIAEFHADEENIAQILVRLSRDDKLHNHEARLRCKDGSIRHVLINSSVYREDGQFIHTGCFTRDITDRKLAEEREHAARREAEAANKAKDEFLAMLGHELRNPLSPIVTALQLMRLRGDPLGREYLVIERQVKHLVRLVEDLLNLSRITRGQVELRREPLELADVLGKALEMSSPLLEERRHHVVVDVPRGLVVSGDAARLTQVFCNLLSNAAKYTDCGGRIVVKATRKSGGVSVAITDNGAGIDGALLPRIFDLFIQAQQTIDRSQGGLGIGLSIVRTLVELHGGTVTAQSHGLGQGAEFTVELPACDASSHAAAESDRVPRRVWRRSRVLVVDDNEDARVLLGESLRELGYEVREAHDGPSALAAVAEFPADIGIVDVGLPVIDGYELSRRLSALRPGIRFVAVTGYGQSSDFERSRKLGFIEHLVKPVALNQIADLLDRLERRELPAAKA
ncbi:MAG TPA: ATP-binding protein [Myxococcales bacterium]|jgi:PAS domain S-box-containing protein